jgi:hypothetical protein
VKSPVHSVIVRVTTTVSMMVEFQNFVLTKKKLNLFLKI